MAMKPYSPDYIQEEGYLAREQEKQLRKAIGDRLYEVLGLYETLGKNINEKQSQQNNPECA